jgi:hypothetical protein
MVCVEHFDVKQFLLAFINHDNEEMELQRIFSGKRIRKSSFTASVLMPSRNAVAQTPRTQAAAADDALILDIERALAEMGGLKF